jgi:ferritin-like metal-binding protein YciE
VHRRDTILHGKGHQAAIASSRLSNANENVFSALDVNSFEVTSGANPFFILEALGVSKFHSATISNKSELPSGTNRSNNRSIHFTFYARSIIMKIETMEDLFLEQIEDLYDAERRLTKALPKMAVASTSLLLREAFESHLLETEGHVSRLETIFRTLGQEATAETCDAMKGLISEGEDMISHTDQTPVRDAGLIAAANRVEHYEIAAYGSARSFAQTLGLTEAASLLDQTLQEEKAADQKLSRLAERMVNDEAVRSPVSQR